MYFLNSRNLQRHYLISGCFSMPLIVFASLALLIFISIFTFSSFHHLPTKALRKESSINDKQVLLFEVNGPEQ
eukprot:m.63486 g.63486  ORF g.63486 m.63486 type:complete len:73 (+) comp8071_c1_seq1:1421-1639(+)